MNYNEYAALLGYTLEQDNQEIDSIDYFFSRRERDGVYTSIRVSFYPENTVISKTQVDTRQYKIITIYPPLNDKELYMLYDFINAVGEEVYNLIIDMEDEND